MSAVDGAVDKKAERRRLMSSDKFNRIGFKEEKVGFAVSSSQPDPSAGQHYTKASLQTSTGPPWAVLFFCSLKNPIRNLTTSDHCCSSGRTVCRVSCP